MLVASAGHPPLLVWRKDRASCEIVRPPSMMIGLDRGPMFDTRIREERVVLSPGDRVLMYSDGLTETQRPDGEMFDRERVMEQLGAHPEKDSAGFIQNLLRAVSEFRGEEEQLDDITIVSVYCRE
jgi:sigma-B regulation protein RsbU (phosphoserine phosphatase)